METSVIQERQRAHALVDTVPAEKLTVVVRLLRAISGPSVRNFANIPLEDEAIGEEEIRAVEASREWLEHNEAISHEKVLTEFGFSPELFIP